MLRGWQRREMGRGHRHTALTPVPRGVRAHPTACTPQIPMVPTVGSASLTIPPGREGARTPTPVGSYIPMGTGALTKGVSAPTKGGLKPQRGVCTDTGGIPHRRTPQRGFSFDTGCLHSQRRICTECVHPPREICTDAGDIWTHKGPLSVLHGLSPTSRCLGLD